MLITSASLLSHTHGSHPLTSLCRGKEALIEKFKNSCIMDEREAYRPKIFHSGGPKEGLPEPFPAPTHLRRKERGTNNRNTLFVGSKSAITA
jgi:hypothetical protein